MGGSPVTDYSIDWDQGTSTFVNLIASTGLVNTYT
jgi:hypothetical protein